MKKSVGERVKFAVVGLGHIARGAILPAFARVERAELVALVSGDKGKLAELGETHRVKHRVTYPEYDALLDSGEVDAVYLALPNNLHADYAVRAARRGVHVLVEKPLATSSRDCAMMIEAALEGGVKLMTAYRLMLEPANLEARRIVHAGEIGDPRLFESTFSFQVGAGNLRLDRAKGGGTLFDIGVYCVNAARHIFGSAPIEVQAMSTRGRDPRFVEVDEMTSVLLRFPEERLAAFTTSFGAAPSGHFRVVGSDGILQLQPAYTYRTDIVLEVTKDGSTERRVFSHRDQFANEIEHFATCVLEDTRPIPDGEEGLEDVLVVEAIQRALRSRRPERIGAAEG